MLVLCPLCNERVMGEGENDLSRNLQSHLASSHGFKGLCDLDEDAPVNGGGCMRPASGGLAEVSYGERRVEEAHMAGGPPIPGEDVMETVRCPVCGQVIIGHALDDLSYNLAKHMNIAHLVNVRWQGKG